MPSESRRTLGLAVLAAALVGLLAGFVLGAVAGWPPLVNRQPDDRALVLMCTALDDVDDAFLERMAEDENVLSTSEHRRMAASLSAAFAYAVVAAQNGEGDDALQATADDLRGAFRQLQGDRVRDHVAELRTWC